MSISKANENEFGFLPIHTLFVNFWPSNLKLNGGEQQKDHEKMAIKEFVIDIMEFVKNRKYRNQGD